MENWPVLGVRYPLTLIEVAGRGRCLVSIGEIPDGATIEVAPVQVLPAALALVVDAYGLRDIMVRWTPRGCSPTLAFPLGLFGLCNHSANPSAELAIDCARRLVSLVSRRRHREGDEITLRYRDPSHSYPA
jgi:hypothetical protein